MYRMTPWGGTDSRRRFRLTPRGTHGPLTWARDDDDDCPVKRDCSRYILPLLACAGAFCTQCGTPPSPPPVSTAAAPAARPQVPPGPKSAGCPAQADSRARAAEQRKDGRLLSATQVLRASLQQCPADPEAVLLLAATLADLGRYDEARKLLDSNEARSQESSREKAVRDLQAASSAMPPRDPAAALKRYRPAVLAESASNHAAARDGFFQAWQSWPERTDFLIDAGLAAHRAGDQARARSLFDRASFDLQDKHGGAAIAPSRFPSYITSYLHPSLSEDGRYAVTTSGDEVAVYDAFTWTVRSRFIDYSYPHPVLARLSPDDSLLAVGNTNGSLQLVDAWTGKLRATGKGHSGTILDLAFRSDGGAVATSGDDGTVRVWELPSARPLLELRGHQGKVRRVAFSTDGTVIVSTSEDKTARIWNAADGKLLRTLEGHGAPVRGLSLHGKWIATSSDDKTIRIWETDTGKELKVLRGHAGVVWRVAFSPDGTRVASFGGDDTVREWNTSTGAMLRTIKTSAPAKVSRADTRPGPEEDSPRLASLSAMAPLAGMGGGTSGAYSSIVVVDVMYRADGRLIAFDVDHTVRDLAARLWDVDADRALHRFSPRQDIVGGMDLSTDGKRLAVALYNGMVRIWDLGSGAAPTLTKVSSHQLRSVAWIPGRDAMVVSDSEGQVFLLEGASGQSPRAIGKHGSAVRALAATSDGGVIASVSEKGELKLWNASDLSLMGSYTRKELSSAQAAAFHPDGKRLAVGGLFGRGPTVIDTRTGAVLAATPGYEGARFIGFTADGSVAQIANDGTYVLVDSATGAVKSEERGNPSVQHFCSWVRAMNPQLACVEPRQSPRFVFAGSHRLPLNMAARPAADLVASSSSEVGIALWHPSRDGELLRLIGPGDTPSACVIAGNEVELFGDDARVLLSCAYGDVRVPFEVCEHMHAVKGLVTRAASK